MKWILSALLIIASSHNAKAWGPEGHMIVGEIAQHQLTPKALSEVKKLLGNSSMADVANWADQIKSQPQWVKTKPWHFVDIPDGETYESITHTPEGDVITAINQMVTTLTDKKSSQNDRADALRFIIHFMGDIHQPLHVGRPSDHGGNLIKVNFEGWKMSLHQLWDSGMITKQNLDYDQYAHYLENMLYFTSPSGLPEIPFKQIINENMAARKQIYSFKNINNGPITIDRSYMDRNVSSMNAQLLMGGKRLAGLLNSIFQ